VTQAPAFTILVPTHDHADTLWYSVQSALHQTRQDFELFIIGDGVPDRTREIVVALIARDPRIRFFDNPKGERHGEAYRHIALQEAAGDYVCYLSDDDLWFPDHLDHMARMLADHDLAHSMQILVRPNDKLSTWMFDSRQEPDALNKMRRSETGFGLTSGGHRLAAYRRLPRGWHPAPLGINTDLYFWLQFLDQSDCRYSSLKWPTTCHFSSVLRKSWKGAERVAELAAWWPRLLNAEQRCQIVMEVLLPINDANYTASCQMRSTFGLADAIGQTEVLKSETARLLSEVAGLRNEVVRQQNEAARQQYQLARLLSEVAGLQSELARQQSEAARLQNKVAALRGSQSWKITQPLRRIAAALGYRPPRSED
jgi:glycosyltransferase involved in cell wall biosynthesis